jgi:hypothetical protein
MLNRVKIGMKLGHLSHHWVVLVLTGFFLHVKTRYFNSLQYSSLWLIVVS